jgi:hypothetical protein
MTEATAAPRRAITGLRPSLTIAEHCGQVRKILEGAGFRNAEDFGSIARGEESDDLLMGQLRVPRYPITHGSNSNSRKFSAARSRS